MAADGWKKLEEAMRKRQEEAAWELRERLHHDEIADKQLKEKSVRRAPDCALPNPLRKRTRRRV